MIPNEVDAELHEGRMPPEIEKRPKRLADEHGFSAMEVPKAHGGRALRIVAQEALWELLVRVTNPR